MFSVVGILFNQFPSSAMKEKESIVRLMQGVLGLLDALVTFDFLARCF